MIEFNKNEKKLTIPSALGNFSTAVSGGVSEERVVEIVDSAITDYDAQVQEQFSGVTDALAALSGATSAQSENIQELSGTVSSNTAAIEELSGRTFDVLEPVAEFPASAETGAIVAKISTEGVEGAYQYDGTEWVKIGGSEGATAYYFKDMERSELAELYTLLETEAGRPDTEGVLSAGTINEKYAFYGNFGEGRENIPLVFWGFYFGRAVFVNTLSKWDTADGIANYMIWMQSDGTFEQQRERNFSFPKDFQFLKNYLQGGRTFPFRYDKGTGVFSVKNEYGEYETLSSASTYVFDASIYHFAFGGADWSEGIAELPFELISGETVLDAYSFPTVRREAINETIDEVTYTQKWYFDYGDFVFSLITNGDLTTRGFEYTEAAAGGGDGLIHLETLSGVTGETNVMYECDGEIFWWNPNSGYCAEWDGLPASGRTVTTNGFSFALNYAEIPDGTVIAEYSYISNSNYSRIIKNGDKLEVRYEADNYETVRQSGVTGETITGLTSNGGSASGGRFIINFEPYSIIFRPENGINFSSFWDGSVNTAHWEMATKPENQVFSGQTEGIPFWDKSGKIIAKRFNVLQGTTYINTGGFDKSAVILYSGSNQLPRRMFIPTSGGTAGQVLTSAGDAEPVWTDMPSGNSFYDIAAIEDAGYSSRRALFAEWVDKVNAEENVSVSGICQTNNRLAILPLTRIYSGTSYTEGYGYNQGWAEFAAIIDGRWYYYQMSSTGNITGTIDRSAGDNYHKLFLASGDTFYTLPVASQSTLGGVKAGSGVTIDSNGVLSAQGGKKQWFLNNMTQAELAELFAEISGITGKDNNSSGITQILAENDFYISGDTDGNKWTLANELWWEDSNSLLIYGDGVLKLSYPIATVRRGVKLLADGTAQWSQDSSPWPDEYANDIIITVNSAGTINVGGAQGPISNLNKFNRLQLHYSGDNNYFSAAPLEYFYRQMETIDGQEKLIQYIGGTIWINGVQYRGTWHWAEWEGTDAVTPDTWATV